MYNTNSEAARGRLVTSLGSDANLVESADNGNLQTICPVKTLYCMTMRAARAQMKIIHINYFQGAS
jgi:hypothetical protein